MIVQEHVQSKEAVESENYFVSMTDMMVGMLFIFIIVLMTFALSYRQREDVSQTDIDALRRAVEVVDKKIEDFRKVYETRARFLEDIERRLNKADVRVQVDPATGVLRLGEGVLFESQSSKISRQGHINISKLAAVLADVLPCYLPNLHTAPGGCVQAHDVTLESIFLEGHADSSGDVQQNWDLSVNRAIATYRDLDADPAGVTKFDNPSGDRLFSVSGYGHFRPVASNDTTVGRAANRRIDLRFNMQIDQSRALNEIRGELRRVLDRR